MRGKNWISGGVGVFVLTGLELFLIDRIDEQALSTLPESLVNRSLDEPMQTALDIGFVMLILAIGLIGYGFYRLKTKEEQEIIPTLNEYFPNDISKIIIDYMKPAGIVELQTPAVTATIDKFIEEARRYGGADYTRRLLAGERLKAFIFGKNLPDIKNISAMRAVDHNNRNHLDNLNYDTHFFFR